MPRFDSPTEGAIAGASIAGGDKLLVWDISAGKLYSTTVDDLATALSSSATPDILKASDIGVSVQAWDAQLDSLSAASANGVSLATAANYAAMRALLDLEAGTDFLSPGAIAAAYQPLDSLVTTDRTFPIRRLTLVDTDAGTALGPVLELYRNSATPAVSDLIGAIEANGKDSAGNKTLYGQQAYSIADPTNGSEDGQWSSFIIVNGTNTEVLRAAGSMIGDPSLLENTIAGHAAPDFGYSRATKKLYHRSEIITEEDDTSEIGMRRVNGTLAAPTNLSVNDLIGFLYWQPYINSAWGGSSPNYARTAQIQSRYTDPNSGGKSGGTLGFAITKHNQDTLTLRAYFYNDGHFCLLGRGGAEDVGIDDTIFAPPGVLTVLGGDIANDKVVALRRASGTTTGLDFAFVDASSVTRIQALNGGTPTTVADIAYTGGVTWGTAHSFSGTVTFDTNVLVVNATDDRVYLGTTSQIASSAARLQVTQNGVACALFNRGTDDGNVVQFAQGGTIEGAIDIAGTTVSLVGWAGAHWSQWASGYDPGEVPIGTVLSTVDELCKWAGEENARLVRARVSDVESDCRVYGVFSMTDVDGDQQVNGAGEFSIRVTGPAAGGDLIESAGDGTARVQEDDIIRSSTIGKLAMGDDRTDERLLPVILYCG